MARKIFDSHLHIIDHQYPLIENEGFLPEPFTVNDYFERMESYNLQGGAIVSGSFQGFDRSFQLAALEKMGPAFVGILQVPTTISDQEILDLKKKRIRGVRLNLRRFAMNSLSDYIKLADRIYEVAGWHTEIYLDGKDLVSLYSMICKFPKASIDHLGLVTEPELPVLLDLVEKGVKVKATGFGRLNINIQYVLKEIHTVDPQALMFGTDLPSTRTRDYEDADCQLIVDIFKDDYDSIEKILYSNAGSFYRVI